MKTPLTATMRNGVFLSLQRAGKNGTEQVPVRSDHRAGPKLTALSPEGELSLDSPHLKGTVEVLEIDGSVRVTASVRNQTDEAVPVSRLSLNLGIDTYMESYPEWRGVHFPTLLRCEKTHFWGYTMSPDGGVIGLASPDPISSWTLDYECENADSEVAAGLHRIYSFSLDLMHSGPLPDRHPVSQEFIGPNETSTWTLFVFSVDDVNEVKREAASICRAPMIDAPILSCRSGDSLELRIIGACSRLEITNPDGTSLPLRLRDGASTVTLEHPGQHTVRAINGARVSEATLAGLRPWSWYLRRARAEADHHKQFASSHCEQWLGLHSAFLARKHFPEPELDQRLMTRFETIYDAMWDRDTGRPKEDSFGSHVYRVFTNSAQMIALLCDAYEAGAGIEWLERAAKLADFVAEWQDPKGYYSVPDCLAPEHNIIYTTVLYPAKCVLELCLIERELGRNDEVWRERYERHFADAGRAIAHLERVRDNLNTEGQDSFEDGMISCSATQLGAYALMEEETRDRYASAAENMMSLHRCLEQLIVPDCRTSYSTLRFWEAQYDILVRKSMNMMNAPHGWTAWSLYAAYYLYLLTGKMRWLDHLFGGMGACAQLVEPNTGELRWSFIGDPFLNVSLLRPDPDRPTRGERYDTVIGETYLPMIASFHYPETEPVLGNSPDVGWSCCNDVHEVFKCMEETVLTNGFVIRREDKSLVGRNCVVAEENGTLVVEADDEKIGRIHVSTQEETDVTVRFSSGTVNQSGWLGMGWITAPRYYDAVATAAPIGFA